MHRYIYLYSEDLDAKLAAHSANYCVCSVEAPIVPGRARCGSSSSVGVRNQD